MRDNQEYSMMDAFLALKDVDDDSVAGMIKPKDLHEGKEFSIYGGRQDLDAAREFLNENEEVQLEVIDVDADSLEHVKDRIEYVGQVILRCNRCHANRFIDMDKLVEAEGEEEGVYNIGDECPNCKSDDLGYELIGQVGKYEEEKPESGAEETSSDEEPAIENDDSDSGELKFENDEASEDEAEEAEEEAPADAEVEEVSDDEEEAEPDMMETSTSEDDDLPDLADLGDEVEDDVKADDDEEDDVKESLNEGVQMNARAQEAWMMNRVIQAMNNEDAYYGSWLYYWPDGETMEMCAYDFADKEDFDELQEVFIEVYKRYHNDGLFEADDEELAYAHQMDSKLGLAKIENFKTYTEELEVLKNTTISEVLGSVLDADRIGRVVVSNCKDDKTEQIYDGEYSKLPINISSAECKSFDVADHQLACNIDPDENHGRRSVSDILGKFSDDKSDNIALYDVATSDEIFRGKKADAIEKFGACGFISIDTPAVIRLTICDPAIVGGAAEVADKTPEESLVENILKANEMSIYRLDKTTTNEYWIKQSILDKEDLDMIYESYVKPCGKELVAEFKKVTGYTNALDEAFDAGYAAAESEDAANDEDEFLPLDYLIIHWILDGEVEDDDYVCICRDNGKWRALGDIVTTGEYSDIQSCLLAAIEDASNYPSDMYDDVQFEIVDEVREYIGEDGVKELAAKSGFIVEELLDDTDDGKYLIVAITKDGQRKLYDVESDTFVDDIADATIYADHDVALDDWRNIDKSQFKRVFVPNYDPEVFGECINESAPSREQMVDAMKKAGRNYHFDRYSDAQIFRMYQKYVLNPAPAKKTEQPEVEIVVTNTCEKCGNRLSDSGSCPVCDEGEEHIDESALVEEVMTPADAVAEAIKHVATEYGYSTSDKEFGDMVLDYIENNLNAGMPVEKAEYKAWASDMYDEINAQLDSINAPESDEEDDWADVDAEKPGVEIIDKDYLDGDELKELVDNEMEFAIKECGTKMKDLKAYFLGAFSEMELGEPDPKQLEEFIAAHLEKKSDVVESVRSFKTRKELAEAIQECKNNSKPYTVRRSKTEGFRYDLVEENNAVIAPGDGDGTSLTSPQYEFTEKVMRIADDIVNALREVYGIEADRGLIVADILQDLRLIRGDIAVRDLPDNELNRMTAKMFKSHEDCWAWIDETVSAVTGKSLTTTPEQHFQFAIKSLDSPSFSTESIRRGIEATRFGNMLNSGRVPFIDADVRPQLEESADLDIEVPTERFDADMNEYFKEAYEDTVIYRTTSGSVESDGKIILEGILDSESGSSEICFTLKPETALTEALDTVANKAEMIEKLTYEVSNNLSEEVFTFKFSE